MRVTRRRSVVKTITFRLLATITTMATVYVFTRGVALSIGIGVVETVVKLLLYYFHERFWDRVPWGRHSHPLSAIRIERNLAPEDLAKITSLLRELGYLKAA